MDIDGYTPFYMMLLLLCHEWFSEYNEMVGLPVP